jgi:uncharacterized protein
MSCLSFVFASTIACLFAAEPDEALRHAARKGDASEVSALLKGGVDPNIADGNGRTPLIHASAARNSQVVALLLRNRADPARQDKEGFTALRAAADSGDVESVRALLDAGADVNFKHVRGLTALMTASSRGNTEIVRLLLSRGANVRAKSDHGYDALSYASMDRHDAIAPFGAWKQALPKHADTLRALMESGATPEEALRFIDPDYLTKGPRSVALLPVLDSRTAEEKSKALELPGKLGAAFAKAFGSRKYAVHAPDSLAIKLGGASAGASERADLSANVCSAKLADAVLDLQLMGSSARTFVALDASAMAIKSSLTDCRSGQLLWTEFGVYGESRGFIIARFISGARIIAEDVASRLPRRPKR